MVVPEKIGKIQITRMENPGKFLDPYNSDSHKSNLPNAFIWLPSGTWKNAVEISYNKYSIKETDFRVKTATFSSPNYIDLTEGLTCVRIYSKYHENFAGVVLDVDYDPDTGLYNYQCQDYSRLYMDMVSYRNTKNWSVYTFLISMLTRGMLDQVYFENTGKIPSSYTSKDRELFKENLSGLKLLRYYDQSLYEGNRYKGNPFKTNPSILMKGKTLIEMIRALVYGSLGFFDIWFNDLGVLQIDPISKKDWETTGLHLTTEAAMKQKYHFSTTNAITRVSFNTQGRELNETFGPITLTGLDLTAFFGPIGTAISDPTSNNKTSAASSTSNSTKTNTTSKTTTNVSKDNPYGTKRKEVWITIDNIFGKSADKKIMNDFAREVQKAGWTTHVGNVGPSYHYAHAPGYSWAGKVWNAVWFVIYGGACAGTLNEAATARWYRKPLVDRGSRTVVGFIRPPCGDIRKGGKYYSYLQRAHDDNFSPPSFKGISNPGQFLTNKAIPWMYAKDGKSLAQSFLQGGDNPEACTKNWKFY